MKTEFRHEYKYLCGPDQLALLKRRLERLLRLDPHAREGSYLIRSLYFDTPDNRCYYENEDGVDPRAKYRLRIYDCKGEPASLERKLKCRGMTHKDSCLLTPEQVRLLISGQLPEAGDPVLRGMLSDMGRKLMRPAVIVQYRRVPFVHTVGNVRITLDTCIASSQAFDRFLSPEIPLRPVLPQGRGILEVKWDQLLPSYIYECLQLEGMQWTSFSKYYICRKYNIHGGSKS